MSTDVRKDSWGTPEWLFNRLHAEFGFVLDVCADAANAKLHRYFTEEIDGLEQDWVGPAWMNPPYGRSAMPAWLAKAAAEFRRGVQVVGLIPAWTSTEHFHQHVIDAGAEIRLIRGRLQFIGPVNTRGRRGAVSPPWGSVVVVWTPGVTTSRMGPPIHAPRASARLQPTLFGNGAGA